MEEVRVRFAPSPTGYLHIGGARTALFNWVFARSKGGKFILRIEDTDQVRSQGQFIDEILNSLRWLGLDWDEGPYYQSQRREVYQKFAERLLSEGKAYRAKERRNKGVSFRQSGQKKIEKEEEESRGEAIIFSTPEVEVEFNDLIRGRIKIDARQFGDIVLIKSDGLPAYNFACVVDDALMGITHILRGEDHISNTPKQILLYRALGFRIPQFAHLPLILDKEGRRMSKRSGATAVSEYRKMGYLPEAIVNFLMLLGWSPGDNREIFSLEEAIRLFKISDVNKTGAVFNLEKLRWINSEYIKSSSDEKLYNYLLDFLNERGISVDKEYALKVIRVFKNRASTLLDFVDWADYLWLDDYQFDPDAVQMHLAENKSDWFLRLVDVLKTVEPWEVAEIERRFRELVSELGIKARELIHPVRVAVSGKRIGPGLFDLLWVLGRDRVISRLLRQVERWKNGSQE